MSKALLFAWVGLLLLLAGSVLITALVPGPAYIGLNIGFAVLMAALIFTVFMKLRSADGLLRLFAVGALMWLGFFLLFSLADFLTR
ncbi:MAG: hypothetical protein L0H63_02970 [Nitrococcus sp.]|nr:hypothetical protein [Nitrococcus sp.]